MKLLCCCLPWPLWSCQLVLWQPDGGKEAESCFQDLHYTDTYLFIAGAVVKRKSRDIHTVFRAVF